MYVMIASKYRIRLMLMYDTLTIIMFDLLDISWHFRKHSGCYLILSFAFIIDVETAFNYTRPSGKLRIRRNK